MSPEVFHRLGVVLCAAAAVFWSATVLDGWALRRRALHRRRAVLAGPPPPAPTGGADHSGGDRSRSTPLLVRCLRAAGRAGQGPSSGGGVRAGEAGPGRRSPGGGSWTGGGAPRGSVRAWALSAGVLCAGYVLLGGGAGVLLGAAGGCAVWRWQRRPVPAAGYDVARAHRELPLAADLLSACAAAGADPVTAARVVGESLGGPVGLRLVRGAAELRLGAAPADAWRQLAALPGAAPLARLLERTGDSGAPAAGPVARLASDARADWGRAATARARRAGVLVTGPMGLCFLPAFLAVGVLPVVIGLATGLLNGGGG
jgi:Type II secretion system (T2SS), protein F